MTSAHSPPNPSIRDVTAACTHTLGWASLPFPPASSCAAQPGIGTTSSTHTDLGSCFVVYCTRSRAGQAGLCGPGWFPAWSRCRVPSPQAPGHTDMPGLLSAHTGRGRSDVQVILPSPQPGRQQREHRSVGRTQDLSEGRQGPGSAQSPRGCCGAPAPSRNHIT